MKEPIVILEAAAHHDLWICHAFFSLSDSNNNINASYRSHLFDRLTQGEAPIVKYTLNECSYIMSYYLVDVIYPN
jgi:hypothetical protein